MGNRHSAVMGWLLTGLVCWGCAGHSSKEDGSDSGADSETDTIVDTASETESPGDDDSATEIETDSFVDTNTGVDTDTGTDTGTGDDTDTGIDTGSDIDLTQCYQGDLEILGDTDFTALDQFTCLNGDLRIVLTGLLEIPPLDLVVVTGDLWISDNDDLVDLSGFSRLVQVNGDVGILSNFSLDTLEGLDSLRYVGEGVEVNYNPELRDLVPLGELEYLRDIRVANLPLVETLAGLERLRELRRLEVYGNSGLNDISALLDLVSVWYEFRIFGNVVLCYCDICDLYDRLAEPPANSDIFNNFEDSCYDTDTDSPLCLLK